ncbi:MAG: hypothetical protein ACTJLK_04750, partial [Anaplasma sp.]
HEETEPDISEPDPSTSTELEDGEAFRSSQDEEIPEEESMRDDFEDILGREEAPEEQDVEPLTVDELAAADEDRGEVGNEGVPQTREDDAVEVPSREEAEVAESEEDILSQYEDVGTVMAEAILDADAGGDGDEEDAGVASAAPKPDATAEKGKITTKVASVGKADKKAEEHATVQDEKPQQQQKKAEDGSGVVSYQKDIDDAEKIVPGPTKVKDIKMGAVSARETIDPKVWEKEMPFIDTTGWGEKKQDDKKRQEGGGKRRKEEERKLKITSLMDKIKALERVLEDLDPTSEEYSKRKGELEKLNKDLSDLSGPL